MDKNKTAAKAAQSLGLTKLGTESPFRFDNPDVSILEAFPNKYRDRDYAVTFEYPEFTSLCPITGQPDYGTIRLTYVPDALCVESKAFKLYMGAFRNSGAFMEEITNKIADDLNLLLRPRRMTVEGRFNPRGGTGISVRVEYVDQNLGPERRALLAGFW